MTALVNITETSTNTPGTKAATKSVELETPSTKPMMM